MSLSKAPSTLNKWLALSRDMLLNVFISGDAAFGYYGDLVLEESICRAITSLMQSSHRWKVLKLEMDGACPYWISTSTQLPKLQEFSLQFYGREEHLLHGYIHLVSSSPRLSKFSLEAFNMGYSMRHYASMLHPFLAASPQLSEILAPILTLSIRDFNNLLASQRSLKILALSQVTFGTVPSNVVSHSLLSDLNLFKLDESTPTNFRLNGLILPNLTRFNLDSFPIAAGSTLIHHLVATAKGQLREINCGRLFPHSFVFPHSIQSLHIDPLYISCNGISDFRPNGPLPCECDTWNDTEFQFLEQLALDTSVLARSAIKKMFCNILEKYAGNRLGGLSLDIELSFNHYPLRSIPRKDLKEFVECLGKEIEDVMGKQTYQFWFSTTYFHPTLSEVAVHRAHYKAYWNEGICMKILR
ncbi:hypothetical protein DL96DRAFT_1559726 [Flagelloscypha sp. PMI_526]|nr:hypothetical protein DL96DRAFT_1559726 [Flagelloscypha sp. PMI_526]